MQQESLRQSCRLLWQAVRLSSSVHWRQTESCHEQSSRPCTSTSLPVPRRLCKHTCIASGLQHSSGWGRVRGKALIQMALRLMQAVQQTQGESGGLGQIMSQLMSDPAVMDGVQGLLGGLTQQPSESRCVQLKNAQGFVQEGVLTCWGGLNSIQF